MTKILREGENEAEAITSRTAATNESHAQHTAPPWSVEEQWRTDADGQVFRFAYWIGADGGEICHSVLSIEDARLIAAAPDLLATARRFVEMYDDVRAHLGPSVREALTQADAAIAKAEGN